MKIRLAALVVAALCLHSHAMAGEMDDLFDSIGAYGNTTAPGAYSAQGQNIYTGGSLFMRIPHKTLRPMTIDPPRLSYGCGGIDMYLGSFSFIKKDEFISAFKNISTQAAATYAFKIALDNCCPYINKTISELQAIANEINSLNISGCETKASLEQKYQSLQRTKQHFSNISAVWTGRASDTAEARGTQTDENKVNANLDAAQKQSDAVKRLLSPGNLVWRALSEAQGNVISAADRELFMSLSGTVIIRTSDPKEPLLKRLGKPLSVADFIHGSSSRAITIWYCEDKDYSPDGCNKVSETTRVITPYKETVRKKLEDIAEKFRNNEKLTKDEIAFINVSMIPIYKTLAVATSIKNAAMDYIWIEKYSELIAAEYASAFIRKISIAIQTALSNPKDAIDIELDALQDIKNTLKDREIAAGQELQKAYTASHSINDMVDFMVRTERAMHSNMPTGLTGNLNFASSVR
jgi:conjugative transfer pilus assembly protein TraH